MTVTYLGDSIQFGEMPQGMVITALEGSYAPAGTTVVVSTARDARAMILSLQAFIEFREKEGLN
jgi:hypothetical protein